jgi:hypothetical protein
MTHTHTQIEQDSADSPAVRRALKWVARAERTSAPGGDHSLYDSPHKFDSPSRRDARSSHGDAQEEIYRLREKVEKLKVQKDVFRADREHMERRVLEAEKQRDVAVAERNAAIAEREEAVREGMETLKEREDDERDREIAFERERENYERERAAWDVDRRMWEHEREYLNRTKGGFDRDIGASLSEHTDVARDSLHNTGDKDVEVAARSRSNIRDQEQALDYVSICVICV